jgi:hypothetical protein
MSDYPLEDKCVYCSQHIGYITHPMGEAFRLGVCDKPECQAKLEHERVKKPNGTDLGDGAVEGYPCK